MTLVIPYRSPGNDISLKYALRSAEAYLPMITGLAIVGDQPRGFHSYLRIEASDNRNMVYITRNIYEKLLKACRHPEVTENFIYGNDDHFLLQMHNIIPDYFSTQFGGNRPYQLTVRNTNSDKNYDVHAPMVMSKTRFENTVAVMDWNKPYGYCIKTVYAKGKPANNFYQYEDLKIRKPMKAVDIERVISGRLWFSIDDRALNGEMIAVLDKLYQTKSRWER